MRMKYIKIRGSIGVKKGQGIDEIEFDLSNKKGLVALSGPNGAGKTTVLELMSPYRTFASRKGSLRHHFFLRDSLIETRFEFNGKIFQTIRKIDSESDRAEAFIVVDGVSAVNGKLKEYDDYIINLFGSQALFYNSVFCAQNSANMSDMRTGEIKELFVEFLQIERLAEYEATAKGGVNFYQKKIDVITGQVEALEESASFYNDIEERIIAKKKHVNDVEAALVAQKEQIENINKKIDELKQQELSFEADKAKKDDIETKLKELAIERTEIKRQHDAYCEEKQSLKNHIHSELKAVDIILEKKEEILNASSAIEELRVTEKNLQGEFETAVETQTKANQRLKAIAILKENINKQRTELRDDLELDGLVTTLNFLKDFEREVSDSLDELKRVLASTREDFSLYEAERKLTACQEKIALSIDPECISTTCPALVSIENAREELSGLKYNYDSLKRDNKNCIIMLEDSISSKTKQVESYTAKIAACEASRREQATYIDELMGDANATYTDIHASGLGVENEIVQLDEIKTGHKKELEKIRGMISDVEALAAKKGQIEIAEEKKRGLEREASAIDRDLEAEFVAFSGRDNASSARMFKGQALLNEIKVKIENNNIIEQLQILVNKQAASEHEETLAVATLTGLNQSLAILKNDLVKKNESQKLLKDKKDTRSEYQQEMTEWEYLKLACSKTGLQALEIDGATPLIVREANILLEYAFGLDSQIKIITQDPETGKEVFWIKVIRHDGVEDDFVDLSGGEKVWIATALSLGMTLVSKQKSARDFMSLFADEKDGALDSEKALEFIKLYRAMMAAGDFETCFFISHNPDVVALADSVIPFSKKDK